ncbi:hypothetical protein B0H14DRAFT_3142639 [Mycena olivaceomarginata]|nr:hypothetical protein B0H14DRAFT_3142639 [Mycena olivaceomarginata]
MSLWLMKLNGVENTWVRVAGSRLREAGSTTLLEARYASTATTKLVPVPAGAVPNFIASVPNPNPVSTSRWDYHAVSRWHTSRVQWGLHFQVKLEANGMINVYSMSRSELIMILVKCTSSVSGRARLPLGTFHAVSSIPMGNNTQIAGLKSSRLYPGIHIFQCPCLAFVFIGKAPRTWLCGVVPSQNTHYGWRCGCGRPATEVSNRTELEAARRRHDSNTSVLGSTGTGKSSFIKLVTKDPSIVIGDSLESETFEVQSYRFRDPTSGRTMIMVDTPGFDDSREGITDTEILKRVANFLIKEYGKARKLTGPHILATDIRQQIHRPVRPEFDDNVVVLTTFWDRVSNEEGVKREKELRSRVFKDLVDGGSHFMRFNRTMDSANNVLRHILTLAPRNIQIQKEICVDGKDLEETAAGSVRQEEMARMISKHTEQIAEVQAEVEAVKQSDKAARQKAEEERDRLQKEVERLQNETAELRKGLDDKQSDKAARQKIEEERDKAQKEVERLRNETAELRKRAG